MVDQWWGGGGTASCAVTQRNGNASRIVFAFSAGSKWPMPGHSVIESVGATQSVSVWRSVRSIQMGLGFGSVSSQRSLLILGQVFRFFLPATWRLRCYRLWNPRQRQSQTHGLIDMEESPVYSLRSIVPSLQSAVFSPQATNFLQYLWWWCFVWA